MNIGHDILISVDEQVKSECYRKLINYVGENNPKECKNESIFKNGIRVIRKQCVKLGRDVSVKQIRKLAQTRLYFLRHTIVMDVEVSKTVYEALLITLFEISEKKEEINAIIKNNFETIKMSEDEEFRMRLAILEKIYRVLLIDANHCQESNELCSALENIDQSFGG